MLSGISARAPEWATVAASVRGPLLTLAAVVLLDVLRRHNLGLLSPFPILMLTVVYTAYAGGLRPALVSIAVTVLYALHYFADPGLPLRYAPDHAWSLLAVAAASLAAGLVVARMHERVRHAEALEVTRADAEALARHFSFLEQASLILGSTRDFDATFRDFSRLVVPTLADWCTIHLVTETGTLRFVTGAHREASKDLVVRALAEYGDRSPPFDQVVEGRVVEVSDAVMRRSAADAEKLKLYRALGTAAVLRIPLESRAGRVGLVTLAMVGDTGRRFTPADVSLAEELARSAGLAVENVGLRDEARESARRAQLVFEAHPQPMWVFDVDTLAFLAVNEAAIHHYGWSREEFLGMTIMDLLAPEDPETTASTSDRTGLRAEVALARHRRRDGTVADMEIVSHEFELDGRRVRLVLATDISERTRTRAALHESEEQLRHAQRVEALGRIAGGVAHDFNNLLTTIRGFGEMLLLDMVPDDRRRHDVQRICQAADRGALLTRQLLSFGRNQVQEPRPVNLNEVVRGMEPLARRLAGADVRLEVRLAAGLGQARIDPAQLEHVVVNLILNARDAMPAGGRLTIETGERRISSVSRGRPVRPGRYVVLQVSDTGEGNEGESSPGATPRQDLGRAIVVGIVRQFGGVVRVSSEAGVGTTVKVYLPRLEDFAAEAEDELAMRSLRGSETVLVAEDEDGVRELLRKLLTEYGYTVLAARHGRDALMLAGQWADGIDLLVTDVVMPEMSGRELAESLLDRRPDLKVLYISGYTDDEVLQRGVRGRDVALVRKPFAAEELLRRTRTILDGVGA
jgi:PAS domain S-box-containing protein